MYCYKEEKEKSQKEKEENILQVEFTLTGKPCQDVNTWDIVKHLYRILATY